jgi:exosortase C (VPDSG-CTERM-specific)
VPDAVPKSVPKASPRPVPVPALGGNGAPKHVVRPASGRKPALMRFGMVLLGLTLVLSPAWLQLVRDAIKDDLHSYAVGIPLICGWLIWQRRREGAGEAVRPARALAVTLALAAAASALGGFIGWRSGLIESPTSWLSSQMLAWVLGVWAAAFWFFGAGMLRRHAFAAGFLIFTVPFPDPVVNAIEIGLQYASAWAVSVSFRMLDITYLRDARTFWLPGLRFEVAQECSGIRSTVVLFITSLLGGHLLLRAAWRRTLLALAVIPLGIARNTLRICTIALLSVHVDPRIIDSPLHHQGGPAFFAISLVPLFLLLWWFRRQEHRGSKGD